MAFEALKEIESWLSREDGQDGGLLGDREGVETLLAQVPPSEREVAAEWLHDRIRDANRASGRPGAGYLKPRYALLRVCELAGDIPEATRTCLELVRLLMESEEWELAREFALCGLRLKPDHRFVRILMKAWRHLPESSRKHSDVQTALQHCPDDPELLWHESRRMDSEGETETAGLLAGRAYTGFVELNELDRAEDPLFRALETESARIGAIVIDTIPKLARHGGLELIRTSLEFAQPIFDQFHLHRELAEALEKAAVVFPQDTFLRDMYVQARLHDLGETGTLAELVARSGIADVSCPFPEALAIFREFYRFRPGVVVQHRAWGMGCVVSNDGETLVIDFQSKPQHPMSFNLARTSLIPIEPDELRALQFTRPDLLQTEREQDPVALVVRAIREGGAETHVKEIKERLSAIVPDTEWPAWWQKTRKLLEADPRVDNRQAYRQVYRLATEGESAPVPLPEIDRRKGLPRAVTTLRRFLKQHGDLANDAKAKYGQLLADWARESSGDAVITAIPLLLEWFPERREEWLHLTQQAFATGARTTAVSTADEQIVILSLASECQGWETAALTALPTRFAPVRARAVELLTERLRFSTTSPEGENWDSTYAELTRRYARLTREVLTLTRLLLEGAIDWQIDEPWTFVMPILNALSRCDTREIADLGWRLLDAEGALVRELRDRACPEEVENELHAFLKSGPLSPAELERIKAFLLAAEELLLAEELQESLHPEEFEVADPSAPYLKPGVTLMTRSTLTKKQRELQELERQLRLELPQAIRKARELGDLSENAEYHAARETQAIVNSQYQHLRLQLMHVQCIEDIAMPEGVVTVGSEVVVRDLTNSSEHTLWILGVGDDWLGHDVVSYASPMGKALLGRKSGETFTVHPHTSVGGESVGKTYQVISLRRKLPDAE